MRRESETFENADIELDDVEFVGCTFKNCKFIYRGQEAPVMSGCLVEDDCSFEFEDAAANTLYFLSVLYGGGFHATVDGVFDDIRKNAVPYDHGPTLHE
jgi:hypothetical protein